MRRIAYGVTGFALACMLSVGILADHKELKEHIVIGSKVWVNGTEVKPGKYLVRYHRDSGQIMLERDGKVIVEAKANVIMNEDEFDQDALLTRDGKLTSIRLGGEREELQLVDTIAFVYPYEDEFYYNIYMWD